MTTPKHRNCRFILAALALAALSALAACTRSSEPGTASAKAGSGHAQDDPEREGHGEHEDAGGNVIVMDAAGREAAGIRLAVVQLSALGEQLRAPGEVLDNAYGTTLITPRVEALVVRRHARLGDDVAAGAALVTLASVAVSDAQAELRIAEQEWKRVSALGREAVSGRRIAEARVAYERARAKARAYGLPGTAPGSVDGEFTLTAPHAGRITEDDFAIGERIEPGRTLFRLVDESVVWVDATLPSAIAARVGPGSAASVVIGDQRLAGTVAHRGHHTSETTRNAVVRIEVPNEGDRLHGGDFVDVYLDAAGQAGAGGSLAVPTPALVQMEGETVVFRRVAEDRFEPVPVRTGAVIGDTTIIEEGIKPGDTVVVDGAFALKAQVLKSQLGEGHAH